MIVLTACVPRPYAFATAYRLDGWETQVTDYWGVPEAYRGLLAIHRADVGTLEIVPKANATLMGAGWAGDRWRMRFEYAIDSPTAASSILSFGGTDTDQWYGAPIAGLRLLFGRDIQGEPDPATVAVGTEPPFAAVPFGSGIHDIEISSEAGLVTVVVDRSAVWSGRPEWGDLPGIYPKWHFAGTNVPLEVSVVPEVTVGFAVPVEVANLGAFRTQFVETALDRQDARGSYDQTTNTTDAWTAIGLVYEFRRTHDSAIAESLDRWAEWRTRTWDGVGSFDGTPGPSSVSQNFGEPGIALALWAHERGRRDWAEPVVRMAQQSGFTSCGADVIGWCRMGNLQPDGTVLETGDEGAAYALNHLQTAETAAFIASSFLGAPMNDRRAWVESLGDRVYPQQRNEIIESLGQHRDDGDRRPWWVRARKYSPAMVYLLGIAYADTPYDPVWLRIKPLVEKSLRLMNTQVVGPMGWRTSNEFSNFTIGTQELAAQHLFEPLVGDLIDRSDERWALAWARLVHPTTLAIWNDTGFWTALAMAVVGAADLSAVPAAASQ